LNYFMLASNASGAQIEPLNFAFYHNSNRVNIGHKVAVGTSFRVAYIMAKLGRFATQITLSRQYFSPLT